MKTFVIGDVHGGYKALLQCLKRSNFDYDKDKLICLGDIADGWPDTVECFEELFKIKNLIYVIGNHDVWLLDWLATGARPVIWIMQGGEATLSSYFKNGDPKTWNKHRDLLNKAPYYYIDDKKRCFVHGGVSQKGTPIEECHNQFLSWDRELWDNRHNLKTIKEFKEVYVGHTSIWNLSKYPANYKNVWFLDTGGGWEGKLTIMNVDTKEFWQSDKVSNLYPGVHGR